VPDIHPLAAGYLERLRREARTLPRAGRADLLADIEAHLAEATSPAMSDAEILSVLDRLGDPAEIIDAQEPRSVNAPSARRGMHEWVAIFLLLFGGFAFGIGWVCGLVLLWSSNAWRARDKVIGTLLVPGGLASVLFLSLFLVGSSGNGRTCHGFAAPVSVNGHPVTAPRASRIVCTGTASTGPHILGIVLAIVLVITPILTSVYLARTADRMVPATS